MPFQGKFPTAPAYSSGAIRLPLPRPLRRHPTAPAYSSLAIRLPLPRPLRRHPTAPALILPAPSDCPCLDPSGSIDCPALSVAMLDGHHDERAADPHTVAAIGASFMVLLEKNKPDKSYVMEKDTYDRYLAVLSNDQSAIPISSKRKFSNRKRFKVLYKDNSPYLVKQACLPP